MQTEKIEIAYPPEFERAVHLTKNELEQHMEELIEDLEDTIDLLRAEEEAVSFIPYENFRKKWLSLHH
jgi:hypothetical protein